MYSLSDLLMAIDHPALVLRELNKLYHSRLRTRDFNPAGIDIFEEDWDNMIILDACRYDVFRKRVDLPGRLESRISRGGTTPEFIRGNFSNKQLYDTVYVTANGWYFKLREEINSELHAVVDVEGALYDPSPVTKEAVAATEKYPNKRLIVHYLHPHAPYVGTTAESELDGYEQPEFNDRLQRREIRISDDVLRRAYGETLDCVIDHVERLLTVFEGKTVVTADHGELLGDRTFPIPIKDYDHPPKLYVKELVQVPWFTYRTDGRKDIVTEPPGSRTQIDANALDERLRQLGYKV